VELDSKLRKKFELMITFFNEADQKHQLSMRGFQWRLLLLLLIFVLVYTDNYPCLEPFNVRIGRTVLNSYVFRWMCRMRGIRMWVSDVRCIAFPIGDTWISFYRNGRKGWRRGIHGTCWNMCFWVLEYSAFSRLYHFSKLFLPLWTRRRILSSGLLILLYF